MTDNPVSEPTDAVIVPASDKKPNKYENTIYKSSYFYGNRLCQLFVNFGVGGFDSYSFVVKNDKITLIHNVDKDNKLGLIRAMLQKLTKEELELVLK